MASLKDLKTSIKSVESIKRITSAMKMVSSAKLKKYSTKMNDSKAYVTEMSSMISNIVKHYSSDNLLLKGSGKEDTHLLLAMFSDRGLCGAFNSNLARCIMKDVQTLQQQGKKVKLIIVGKKSISLSKHFQKEDILASFDSSFPEYATAEAIANKVLSLYAEKAFDICKVYNMTFVTVLTQKLSTKYLVPFSMNSMGDDTDVQAETSSMYEYEPNEQSILESVLPKNIKVQVYFSMLESFTSEQASKMTSMDNATKNASEIIGSLKKEYNTTRQAKITSELIEIISGAEALK